jgi:ABC-type bacteriocin/lantibiotic exporter with double-glycine peptidase domain
MLSTTTILQFLICPFLGSSIFFILLMKALKWYYFNDKGENIDLEWIKSTKEELLSKSNEYHNKATYKDFEF